MTRKIILFVLLLSTTASFAQRAKNVVVRDSLSYAPYVLSNIWGHVDSLGNEYALVGTEFGVSIVDVTNPANIREVKRLYADTSIWRELKTWKGFAYVTNEEGGGLMIIDLRSLPNAAGVTASFYTGRGLSTIHALYIDEKGVVYLTGSNIDNGGVTMFDVNTTPGTPIYLGSYAASYVHDCYARGDTLYAAHIYLGYFTVVDVTNKANPVVLAQRSTPSSFTHNLWPTDNTKYIFTTDEVNNAYIASYDITDLSNIDEVQRIQHNPGSQSIPHNVHTLKDHIVTSYYKDGFTIHDVTYPYNMIEIGYFDTEPTMSGGGFEGCWGVYPYLPSKTIVASDINRGLYVCTPDYKKACYLEGKVTDANNGNPLDQVNVSLVNVVNGQVKSNGIGFYATGVADSGTYIVTFYKNGYDPFSDTVRLNNGVLTKLNVTLTRSAPFSFTSTVVDKITGVGIPNAKVLITDGTLVQSLTCDLLGRFTINNFFPGAYDITAGKWGFVSNCSNNFIVNGSLKQIALDRGYYDDFTFNFGWTTTSTATTGDWVREEPVGTANGGDESNPDIDVFIDCNDQAYVTGNGGGQVGADDIDGGEVVLRSPIFDLSRSNNAHLSYYRWFYNSGGIGNPDDKLKVQLTNGLQTITLESLYGNIPGTNAWTKKSFALNGLINYTNNMRLIVTAGDYNAGHLVEAGFDGFMAIDSTAVGVFDMAKDKTKINIFPNPNNGKFIVEYMLDNETGNNTQVEIRNTLGSLIYTQNVSSMSGIFTINTTLADGVYYVGIKSDKVAVTKQMIVVNK